MAAEFEKEGRVRSLKTGRQATVRQIDRILGAAVLLLRYDGHQQYIAVPADEFEPVPAEDKVRALLAVEFRGGPHHGIETPGDQIPIVCECGIVADSREVLRRHHSMFSDATVAVVPDASQLEIDSIEDRAKASAAVYALDGCDRDQIEDILREVFEHLYRWERTGAHSDALAAGGVLLQAVRDEQLGG